MEFTEIERKFLVQGESYKSLAHDRLVIRQGFLNSDPQRVVRVRLTGEEAWLTIKGIGDASGRSRFEWEKALNKEEGKALFELCEPGTIEKYRYLVRVDDSLFEVDEFLGENKGLVIAEIELEHPEQLFSRPDWLGPEVTGQEAYYNSQLSKRPYRSW